MLKQEFLNGGVIGTYYGEKESSGREVVFCVLYDSENKVRLSVSSDSFRVLAKINGFAGTVEFSSLPGIHEGAEVSVVTNGSLTQINILRQSRVMV